jgi:hypothetical protein
MANDVQATLDARETTYGDFVEVARVSQELKRVIHQACLRPDDMYGFQKEALDMICSKMARIVCGDPKYKDSWHDIAGYAKLVEDRL